MLSKKMCSANHTRSLALMLLSPNPSTLHSSTNVWQSRTSKTYRLWLMYASKTVKSRMYTLTRLLIVCLSPIVSIALSFALQCAESALWLVVSLSPSLLLLELHESATVWIALFTLIRIVELPSFMATLETSWWDHTTLAIWNYQISFNKQVWIC